MSGRPSARILSVAALTAAILGITGCYGQTDLASHVGRTGATLNARGAANNGPADAYFEYWKDSAPGAKLTTPAKTIPAGSDGPFAQNVSGLDDGTAYSFRLCGKDATVGPVCAQTRSFITGAASVQAHGATYSPYGENGLSDIDVNVATGPAGRVFAHWIFGGPGGPYGLAFDLGSRATDNVTCVNVAGNVAMIAYRQVPPFPDDVPLKSVMYLLIVDGGPPGSGQDRISTGPTFVEMDPNSCPIPANPEASTVPLRRGDASVSAVEPD